MVGRRSRCDVALPLLEGGHLALSVPVVAKTERRAVIADEHLGVVPLRAFGVALRLVKTVLYAPLKVVRSEGRFRWIGDVVPRTLDSFRGQGEPRGRLILGNY